MQGPLAESPTFVVMQAGRLALDMAARALGLAELSVAEFAALRLIQRFGGISQGAVAERLGFSKASMSGIASALERRHLLDRRQDLWKPASRALYITMGGVELLHEAERDFAPVDARFQKCLGPEAFQALLELPPRALTPVELALRAAGWR